MRIVVLLAVFLVTACASGTSDGSTTSAEPATTAPATTVSASTTSSAAPGASAGCPTDTEFVDRGRVLRLDQPTTDTNSVGLVSWQVDDGCERFEVDFETAEGAPATTPPSVVVDFLDTRQVLRVWTDVSSTVITDQLVETNLVDRLFVVRSLDGGMFLDLHLRGPASARVAISNSPARMSLELQTGPEAFVAAPALITDAVVVTSPSVAVQTSPNVDVSGYSRTFEGTVLVRATQDESVVAETNVTAADWVETWGEFYAPLTLPTGQVDLFVGEESPQDGALTGATLSLTVR